MASLLVGVMKNRMLSGLKALWSTTKDWLYSCTVPAEPMAPIILLTTKRQDIPILQSYVGDPGSSFWSLFPKRDVPVSVASRIDVTALRKALWSVRRSFTCHMWRRGMSACMDLTEGADSCIKGPLPGIFVANCPSASVYGHMITEKLATWVENDFVAGPFDSPPLANFRVNPIMAVVKGSAVRPVINLSAPPGRSYNDNVVASKLEKVRMATTKFFGYSVVEAGRGAVFSKQDAKDAYKNVPSKMSDWS